LPSLGPSARRKNPISANDQDQSDHKGSKMTKNRNFNSGLKTRLKTRLKTLVATSALTFSAISMTFLPTQALAKNSSGHSKTVHINPTSLRKYMLSGDLSVVQALNNVYIAKSTVNAARGNLLPSINIGAGVSGIASGGPTFAVNAVSFLVPFLLPSNWFALSATENQLAATGYAFNLVELNEYASAYAIYNTILGDYELRDTYQRQYDNLKQIVDVVAAKVEVGQATQADLSAAMFNFKNAETLVYATRELIRQEQAAINALLNFPIETNLVFDTVHPEPLSIEGQSPQAVLDRVFPRSNEAKQVLSLIKAAENATWTKVFSFLGGASLNVQNNSGGALPTSFSSLQASGSLNLGFSYFPNIEISSFNERALRINYKEIYKGMGEVIASSLNSVKEGKEQLDAAILAEEYAQKEFEGQFELYRLGNVDIQKVLQGITDINTAAAARVRAKKDLDNQRVNLYRVAVTGQFNQIPGCQIKGTESSTPAGIPILGWITDLFSISGGQTQITIDQLCRGPIR
jgi:outer membrane protein, multidrug efflux system